MRNTDGSRSSGTPIENSGVIPLHEVLLDELGGAIAADPKDLAEYQELAQGAREACARWTEQFNGKKKNKQKCEAACEAMVAAEARCLDPLFRILHRQNRSALCLSGGGIRSATFALGVIHSLAKYSYSGEPGADPPQLLAEFDYLSTVSGGGYIGSWLSSWITHEDSINEVIRQLASTPTDKLDPEPKPLIHLRDYSNYLNPKLGLFSADTWTLVATAVRNILLNWLVLIPFMAAALLPPKLFLDLLQISPEPFGAYLPLLLGTGFAFGVLGTAYIMFNLPSFGAAKEGEQKFLWLCALPLTLSALCLTLWWGWLNQLSSHVYPLWAFATFGASMHLLGLAGGVALSLAFESRNFRRGRLKVNWLLVAVAGAIVTGALVTGCFRSLHLICTLPR